MPAETILINQRSRHNKFWIVSVNGNNVMRKWGRIGTKGQQRTDAFDDDLKASRFAHDKEWSQRSQGYQPCNKQLYNKLSTEAAVVGTKNKCLQIEWVEFVTDQYGIGIHGYNSIDESKLCDPKCNPALLVSVEFQKPQLTNKVHLLIYTNKGIYTSDYSATLNRPIRKLDNTSKIYNLAIKIGETINDLI